MGTTSKQIYTELKPFLQRVTSCSWEAQLKPISIRQTNFFTELKSQIIKGETE
jgi:hypothetical protein